MGCAWGMHGQAGWASRCACPVSGQAGLIGRSMKAASEAAGLPAVESRPVLHGKVAMTASRGETLGAWAEAQKLLPWWCCPSAIGWWP